MTTPWINNTMGENEPSRTTSNTKYEDVMAEFRANGRDLDTSSVTSSRTTTPASGCISANNGQTNPTVQKTTASPCTLCGVCPPLNAASTEFTPSKEIGPAVSSPSLSPTGINTSSNTLNSLSSQFTNMDLVDIQQQFGVGIRKLLVDKSNLRQESTWPFVHRDYSQTNLSTANGVENIWQLAPGQYPRQNSVSSPIGTLNTQLQRLQQLRQKKPAFMDGYQECVFCRNNGEPVSFYRTHELKDQLGRVICPVLRAFSCPCCGATGDNAHTIKYCPEKGPDFISSLAQLKNLRIPSGKRRMSIPRRFSGTQELGTWFNPE